MISDQDQANLERIVELMDEAYDHYFANSDGHCKSSEGHVSLSFNNYFERRHDGEPLQVKGVEIYSYVLGPHRSHYFFSTDDALRAVASWYEDEMQSEYGE